MDAQCTSRTLSLGEKRSLHGRDYINRLNRSIRAGLQLHSLTPTLTTKFLSTFMEFRENSFTVLDSFIGSNQISAANVEVKVKH